MAEERWRTGGFAAEVTSRIQEEAFDYLDGPVVRVGGSDVPTPYNGALEAATIPNAERVLSSIEKHFRF